MRYNLVGIGSLVQLLLLAGIFLVVLVSPAGRACLSGIILIQVAIFMTGTSEYKRMVKENFERGRRSAEAIAEEELNG